MAIKRKPWWNREERKVRSELKELGDLLGYSPLYHHELDRLRAACESQAESYDDLLGNIGAIKILQMRAQAEVDSRRFEGYDPGRFSVFIESIAIGAEFSQMLAAIRGAYREHGGFMLEDYIQVSTVDKAQRGDRLYLGEILYKDDYHTRFQEAMQMGTSHLGLYSEPDKSFRAFARVVPPK